MRKSYQDYDKSNYIELDKPTSSKEITEYYEYTPDGRVIYNERKENTIENKTDYIWANTTLWCEINEGEVYYHHTDHLGTTEVITDSNGKIIWHADYEAFGSVMNERGEENFTPNYTGKFFDESSGLYYFNARWYDCELGRFTTQDPARDGVNWWIYCGGNPITYIDPTGMWTDKMKNAVEKAIALNKTYTHGTWNSETKKTEGAWDCDVFVEYIITSDGSGAKLPENFNDASSTNVPTHLVNMKSDLKDSPEKGTNIVFHGGNHAMLLGLNEDGSVDVTHISSTNKDQKATNIHWTSLVAFENHWKKQGNGELKYVPLNDYVSSNTNNSSMTNVNKENAGSGK